MKRALSARGQDAVKGLCHVDMVFVFFRRGKDELFCKEGLDVPLRVNPGFEKAVCHPTLSCMLLLSVLRALADG